MKKRWIVGIIVILLLSGIFITGCEDTGMDESDDPGGAGADFDPTLYYTKTEVDAKIAETYSNNEIDSAIDYATPSRGTNWTGGPSTYIDGSNNSYATGISLGNPEGANFVMLFISDAGYADSAGGCHFYGGCSNEADPVSFQILNSTVDERALFGNVFLFHVSGDDMKFWVTDVESGGFNIDTVWFRERNE